MVLEEGAVIDSIFSFLMNFMFPIKMLLKLYSLCILAVDIIWVYVNTILAILQAVYELFRPPPKKSVRLETALIVGSGRGVGKEIALQMAELGAIVLCVDKNSTTNEETVQAIKDRGGSAAGYTFDITKKENVSSLAEQVRRDVGAVSMLFYCCGVPSPRALHHPPQDMQDALNLTLVSFYWLIEQFLPTMKAADRGHVVALTSVAGLDARHAPLSVAQFAVQGLAEALAEQLRAGRRGGVRVTLVHVYPFIVDSAEPDLSLRLPSYFGTISPAAAATSILDSVRRDYEQASVPAPLLYLGHVLRVLPRRATVLIRDLLDTGVDFA